MRINEGFLSGSPVDRQSAVDPMQNSAAAVRSAAAASAEAGDTSSARELAHVVAAVNETEDVRTVRVQDVSRRLFAGEYATRDAAERTAEAILQSAD